MSQTITTTTANNKIRQLQLYNDQNRIRNVGLTKMAPTKHAACRSSCALEFTLNNQKSVSVMRLNKRFVANRYLFPYNATDLQYGKQSRNVRRCRHYPRSILSPTVQVNISSKSARQQCVCCCTTPVPQRGLLIKTGYTAPAGGARGRYTGCVS